ncbi:hypothetical protein QFZ45_004503 [Pseudomonas synxantha]|nr:transposase [Pseudomonas synxantha]MDQ0981325.1 hypothetical protein [Pseudomonas synxantha]
MLKQMLAKMQSRVGFLEEENALLRQRLVGRKSEQAVDPATPQLALFNEAESVVEPIDEAAEEEAVAPTQRRGKRKVLPADLPRIEVIHELPEHELTCACDCRKHAQLIEKKYGQPKRAGDAADHQIRGRFTASPF